MTITALSIDDLIRALDEFPSHRAIDVFGSSVAELREGAPIAGLSHLGDHRYQLVRKGRTFQLDWFPERDVLRLRRSAPQGGPTPALVAGAGAAIGAAISGSNRAAGGVAGALLGLLVGAAIGAAGSTKATKVFTLELDPQHGEWRAYDGGLVPWMKEQLLVPDAA